LEWNKSYRVIGFLGDETAARAAYAKLPPLPVTVLKTTKGEYHSRLNVALDPADDTLFGPPERPAER
jgi:hypothetical protein